MTLLTSEPSTSHRISRTLKKNWRDTRVVLRAFSRPILIFFALIIVFGLAYWQLSLLAEVDDPPSAVEAVFLVLAMIFLQANVPFPDPWYLQIFFFIMPVVGVAWLGAGAANLGVKLFNRSARGQEWEVALASLYSDHVIVCGVGKLGYRVILQLLKFGQAVVAIEMDEKKPFIELVRHFDVPVIIGDARQPDVLSKAGLERATSIVCSTQDDLSNLDIALDAREMKPDLKVVLRMFDADLAEKIERGFGIHTAFSASALAAPAFAAAATRAHIEYSFYVGDALLHVSQVTVDDDSPLAGMTMHPQYDELIHADDTLVVFATLETLGKIGGMNHNHGRPHPASQNLLKRMFSRRPAAPHG
jgi:voltage-gated potassium channel